MYSKPLEKKNFLFDNIRFIQRPLRDKGFDQTFPAKHEIISKDALLQLASILGKQYTVSYKKVRCKPLYNQLGKDLASLKNAYHYLGQYEEDVVPLSIGTEWIVDNYPLLEDHINETVQFFRDGLDKRLPTIKEGPYKGYPRIYHLAHELIQHTDSLIDESIFTSFIEQAQSSFSLTVRELWAFPIMLRLVLIKNLAFLAEFNVVTRKHRTVAHNIVSKIFSSASTGSSEGMLSLASEIEKSPNVLSAGYLVCLFQELKNKGTRGSLCIQMLNQKISEMGYDCQTIVDIVLHLHTSNQISISNCFGSLRKITIENWEKWFEKTSVLHRILNEDPTKVYQISDFQTRDRCRHRIEFLSKKLKRDEIAIAKQLILFVRNKIEKYEEDDRNIFATICYYLIDEGISEFEKHINFPNTYFVRLKRWVKKRVFPIWMLSLLITTLPLIVVPVVILSSYGASFALLATYTLLFSFLACEVSLQILHWVIFYFNPPKPLPKLRRKEAIKNEYQTLIAVQTIFSDRDGIRELVEDLQVHSFSNRDPNLYFVLVADLEEAKEQQATKNQALVSYAESLVSQLNQESDRFFLVIRDPQWSATQQLFMGWERKRGKVHQLNQLVMGNSPKGVHLKVGDFKILQKTKYILTLDEDTKIPPDGAIKLVKTAAHPLNKPRFDKKTGKIIRGYGIIQPSLESPLETSFLSRFSKIFSDAPGTDPYTRLISSTSQDLFNQGSYVGKGIYDVLAFEKSLNGWIPEGKILSHDLLEGFFSRAGYASDVLLLETFPIQFNCYTKRLNRWIRGDWQLLPWIFSKVLNNKLVYVKNPLSLLERWMILDNMRRSLVFLVAFIMTALSFSVLPGNPYGWFALIFISINPSLITNSLDAVVSLFFGFRHIVSITYRLMQQFKKQLYQSILKLAFLPTLALTNGYAILVTIYRLFVSQKNLLEWTTAAATQRGHNKGYKFTLRIMFPVMAFVVAIYLLLYLFFPEKAILGLPIFILWIVSPFIVMYVGKPPFYKKPSLNLSEKEKLFQIAWDTWRFYDELITRETNYLVPDNIQMVPERKIAMRTSPTNIGFQFLSTLSAYDFGFIDAQDMLLRLQSAFSTIEKMEKCQGHLYNWYNIETLEPLYPRYVSSVDSGNFISYCITTRAALKNLSQDPIFTSYHWKHLRYVLNELNYDVDKAVPLQMRALYEQLKKAKIALENKDFKKKITVQRQFEAAKNSCSLAEIFTIFELLEELRVINNKDSSNELQKEIDLNISQFFNLRIPSWNMLHEYCQDLEQFISITELAYKKIETASNKNEIMVCLNKIQKEIPILGEYCNRFHLRVQNLLENITEVINKTNFNFLYSKKEKLLAIGYQVETNILDPNYYSLLASEASITSLVAIAKGDVPAEHWFSLGRQLVKSDCGKTLLSWSGSAFEYLMPLILIDTLPKTLISQSVKIAVQAQKRYGAKHNLPWGISESGYAITDKEDNYQYKAFGIPELGLKRGLEDDYVVSPYSTFLSLPVDMHASMENIENLRKYNANGVFGFKEAIDFTPDRLSHKEGSYVLESYLAHHQGMILSSINNVLNGGIFQKRFQNCTLIKSVSSLLQEPFPYYGEAFKLKKPQINIIKKNENEGAPIERIFKTAHTPFPHTHILSNGKLSEVIDNSGSGYLFYDREILLTRWREKPITNDNGYYIFIRDLESGEVWSLGYEPTRVKPDYYEVIYSPEKVAIHRRDFGIGLVGEITISTENGTEIRRLTIKNESKRRRRLEITSYGEVTLATKNTDASHSSFSNLFVESEFDSNYDALIFRRVPRSCHEKEIFMGHLLIHSVCCEHMQWETDRSRFIGRNRTIHNPVSFEGRSTLSQTAGRTLDPIFSIRAVVEVATSESEIIAFITAAAETKDDLLQILKSYYSPQLVRRTFEMSLVKSNVEIRYEHIPMEKIHLYQEFSKALVFHLDPVRTHLDARINNRLKKEALWRMGISGDYPIVLIRLTESSQLSLIKDLLYCHNYLDKKCLDFDVIILNEVVEGYRSEFQETLIDLLASISSDYQINSNLKKGRVFLLNIHEINSDELRLMEAIAHVVFDVNNETIIKPIPIEDHAPTKKINFSKNGIQFDQTDFEQLQFFNGFGGFIDHGRAYRILTQCNKVCPHPWSNVIGGNTFGFLITETGGGYTWSENSQSNRLSPWTPDSTSDPKGEMIYIRDCETKEILCPFSPPAIVEHHFGYSKFITESDKIKIELTLSCSLEKRVKWWNLKIHNLSSKLKELEIYLFIEWVLNSYDTQSTSHIVCGFDPFCKIIHAVNHFNNAFSGRYAFIGCSNQIHSFSTSKRDFIGRNQELATPVALQSLKKHAYLNNKVSCGTDSIGALHHILQIPPGQDKEIVFYLGEEDDLQTAKEASILYQEPSTFKEEMAVVKDFWLEKTQKIEIQTDDASFNILMNGWLTYQTLSCRLLAKTGFYQNSGAFGFRDQLQDSMAFLAIDPTITRRQLILHASRQFVEGDVQHWWSAPQGKGVRTRFSDDYLWLPYTLSKYLEVTNETSILDEIIGFLEGDSLKEGENEVFFEPRLSSKYATMYEHCTLAIDRALKFGAHGLPFIGCGDWNDGMNEVGVKGEGESVWLGWFLYDILNRFQPIAKERNDEKRANFYLVEAEKLLSHIEQEGWDGEWYRRAYFDDGTPIGSKISDGCKIDSLTQSWSVIANSGDKKRQHQAIESVFEHLVKRDSKVIRLLTPSFSDSKLDPGYIKAYPSGVRENGAQYTHAAAWVVMATAQLGQGNKAYELFQIINPINHTLTPEGVRRYKGEPYVLAGDVYSESPYEGQAGWTWYTGAAGWLYQVGLEEILGLKVRGEEFVVEPCIPASWKEFKIKYKYKESVINIHVLNPESVEKGVKEIKISGEKVQKKQIKLPTQKTTLEVEVIMGAPEQESLSIE